MFQQININQMGHVDDVYVGSIMLQDIIGFPDDFMQTKLEASELSYASVTIQNGCLIRSIASNTNKIG